MAPDLIPAMAGMRSDQGWFANLPGLAAAAWAGRPLAGFFPEGLWQGIHSHRQR